MLTWPTLLIAWIGVDSIAAQRTDFEPGTGVRSLWIPYKTVSGTPQASIASVNTEQHRTVYVISCPTAQADCAIAPNITLTEGTDVAKWTSTATTGDVEGTVALSCALPTMTADDGITCHQDANNRDLVRATSQIMQLSDAVYQAVEVTATMGATTTGAGDDDAEPETTSEAPSPTSASSSVSTGAAAPTGLVERWVGVGAGAISGGLVMAGML